MENMERKNLELTDDQLKQTNGGTTNGGLHEVLFPSVPLLQEDNNMKNAILNELDDDILDHISGGIDESSPSDTDELLKPMIGICSNCGSRVMLGGGPCSRCGVTPADP